MQAAARDEEEEEKKKQQVRGFDVFTPFRRQRWWPHTLQEAGHVLQLRDVVWLVAAVLLQQGEDPVVFAAGVARVEGLQLGEHLPPRSSLLLRVIHPRNGLATGSHDLYVSPAPCAAVTLVLLPLNQPVVWHVFFLFLFVLFFFFLLQINFKCIYSSSLKLWVFNLHLKRQGSVVVQISAAISLLHSKGLIV